MRLARFRFRIARRAASPWIVAGLFATVTGTIVWSALAAAEREHRSWGPTAAVVVTTRTVAAGDVLDGGNTRRRPLPRALTATDALAALPADAVAAVGLAEGEPVRQARLVGRGVAAAGTLLVAIPLTTTTPPLRVGDHVDLYGRASEPLAVDVAVVAVAADRVVVAAAPAQVGPVVLALADGPLVVAVHR